MTSDIILNENDVQINGTLKASIEGALDARNHTTYLGVVKGMDLRPKRGSSSSIMFLAHDLVLYSGGSGVSEGEIVAQSFALSHIEGDQLVINRGGGYQGGVRIEGSHTTVASNLTLESGDSPTFYTGTGNAELNRYLQLINSFGFSSASGLKAGGVLIAENYDYANPGKNDLVVKGKIGIGTATPKVPLDVNGNVAISGSLKTNEIHLEATLSSSGSLPMRTGSNSVTVKPALLEVRTSRSPGLQASSLSISSDEITYTTSGITLGGTGAVELKLVAEIKRLRSEMDSLTKRIAQLEGAQR